MEGEDKFANDLISRICIRSEELAKLSIADASVTRKDDFPTLSASEMTSSLENEIDEDINKIKGAHFDSTTLCKLFDLLRSSVQIQSRVIRQMTKLSTNNLEQIYFLPLSLQEKLLIALCDRIRNDDPRHFIFPGDKDSYLQISSTPIMNCTQAYCIAFWIKIPINITNKGFILFRSRSPVSGVDAIISNPNSESTGSAGRSSMLQLTLRTNIEKRGKDEVQCKVYLTAGKWHLITVKQTCSSGTKAMGEKSPLGDRLTVSVDGVSELSTDFKYPFFQPVSESVWVFGLGFRGAIASITLYAGDLSQSLQHLLWSLGPYVSDMSLGPSCPQSSFDTGHLILGSLIAKGTLAAKACRVQTEFALHPACLTAEANLPITASGQVYPEHIEMTPRLAEGDLINLQANITGNCTIRSNGCSIVDAFGESGGLSLALYMLWTYCSALNTISNCAIGSPDAAVLQQHAEKSYRCVLQCLELCGHLLRASFDLKEQFIQTHGFHVVAYCLSNLVSASAPQPQQSKGYYMTEELITQTIHLVVSLGPDAKKGDAITAALQGLLFDFRIWGNCSPPMLKFYLQNLSSLLLECGDQLNKSIGLQRLLDIFRLHVSRIDSITSNVSNGSVEGIYPAGASWSSVPGSSEVAIDCADVMYRLLIISMDSVIAQATKNKTSIAPELEIFIICLEETTSSLLAERILHIMENLKALSPGSLNQALQSTRYFDTVVISLLTKKGFSMEVRQGALSHFLFFLQDELQSYPGQILQCRKVLNSVGSNRYVSSALDSSRMRSVSNQMEELLRYLEKGWVNINMIAEVLSRAIKDGVWDLQPQPQQQQSAAEDDLLTLKAHEPSDDASVNMLPATTKSSPTAMSILVESLLRIQEAHWLLLPLLPELLQGAGSLLSPSMICSLEISQQALMAVNVSLKTEESQCEALAAMPDRSWIRLFVRLACRFIGDNPTYSRRRFAASTGSAALPAHESAISATCAELALDSLALVLEHKTRYHITSSWSTWNCLLNCIRSIAKAAYPDRMGEERKAEATGLLRDGENTLTLSERVESKILKRVVSLVLQRLVKGGSEGWTTHLMNCVTNMFALIDNKKLCGGAQPNPPKQMDYPDTLIDTQDTFVAGVTVYRMQTVDESQILSFMIDLMTNLRKSASKGVLNGTEWRILKPSLRIVLHTLPCLNDAIADRVGMELVSYLRYMSEPWSPLSAEKYKSIFYLIISSLRKVIEDPKTQDFLKSRYTAVVFAMMHFFVDMRHSQAVGKVKVPEHVWPLLDDLIGMVNCNDIDLIFKLLDVAMHTADSISFVTGVEGLEENEVDRDSEDMQIERIAAAVSHVSESEMELIDACDFDMSKHSAIAPVSTAVDPNPSETNPSVMQLFDDPFGLFESEPGQPTSNMQPVKCPPVEEFSLFPDFAIVATEDSSANPILNPNPNQATPQLDPYADPAIIVTKDPPDLLSPSSDREKKSRESKFLKWLSPRQGKSCERIDSERARLARSMDTLDLAFQATYKFFRKSRRKVESECFLESHRCQWKIGVAHEGHFPGRKRIVFRPRFENEYGETFRSASAAHSSTALFHEHAAKQRKEKRQLRKAKDSSRNDLDEADKISEGIPAAIGVSDGEAAKLEIEEYSDGDGDEEAEDPSSRLVATSAVSPSTKSPSMDENVDASDPNSDLRTVRALAVACAGYIKDVADPSPSLSSSASLASSSALESMNHTLDPLEGKGNSNQVHVPGSGWGLVDADDSEEGGFGVVGLANPTDHSPPISTTASNPVEEMLAGQASDMMGDVRQLEDNFKHGRNYTDTGPCHSGTRRVGSGPAKFASRVMMVTASGNFWGHLSFNGKEVFFCSSLEPEDGLNEDSAAVNLAKRRRMRRRRWVLSSLSAIYLRRFRLRDSAMEVFFIRGKHRNFFVDFGHTRKDAKQRNEFARLLMSSAPPTAFKQTPSMSTFRLVYEHGIQEKWLQGKMSNFDYIMALNTIAGRSYNDLCQYPVFPWIIADYSSSMIDLSDPSIYRDLTKPMGALNPNRLNEFLERFHSFEENVTTGIPAFMYGSHYSTMVGVVLHFLVRLQPFAALHKEMQNGHFDVPDRLFSSIPRSFKHNTNQLSEVKELTPEWFTTPEMFKNINNFDLGVTQDGDVVDDVELPPWAATAEEFVRINAQALESDYVTQNLHHWIDLIFGYKQRGPDSIEANNVFFYLTYYGAVDHYLIEDEVLRKATELQIAHFGQTPMQLFKTPHPGRVLPVSPVHPTAASSSAASSSSGTATNTTNSSSAVSTLPPTRLLSKCFLFEDWTAPSCEEETVAIESACTAFNRNSTSAKFLTANVLTDRVLTLLDNGVIEVYKYSTSEVAKQAIIAYQTGVASVGNHTSSSSSTSNNRVRKEKEKEKSTTASLDEVFLSNAVVSGSLLVDGFIEDGSSVGGSSEHGQAIESVRSSDSSQHVSEIFSALSPLSMSTSNRILAKKDPLIAVCKETTHFDLIPRVPLVRIFPTPSPSSSSSSSSVRSAQLSDQSSAEKLVCLSHFSKCSNLIFTFGHVDGRVCVRELDLKSGSIRSCGDYRSHKVRVVSLSTDSIPNGNTDVVVSCDQAGRVMVWTVSRIRNSSASPYSHSYVISRRPQRLFRCPSDYSSQHQSDASSTSNICCDISWQMGIVVAVSGALVSMFSIERDELLRSFEVSATDTNSKVGFNPSKRVTCTGSAEDIFSNHGASLLSTSEQAKEGGSRGLWTRRVVLSDEGSICLHLEEQSVVSEEEVGQPTAISAHRHSLVSYSLSGSRTAMVSSSDLTSSSMVIRSAITFLSCPERGPVLLCGQQDGTVLLLQSGSLSLLFKFKPHLCCTSVSINPSQQMAQASSHKLNSSNSSSSSSYNAAGVSTARDRVPSNDLPQLLSVSSSAIICVTLGPDKLSPGVLCIISESGNMFLRALPDFIKWEKHRSPSALAQLAAVPLQAVKGTIQQAQNWTAETAGAIAQNAKSLAEELKKMKQSTIVKNVTSFFGGFGNLSRSTDAGDGTGSKK